MVAEGGRYKTSSAGRAQSVTATHSSGNYGSTSHTSDISSSHLPGAASSAPVFGRIRITQSVERDVRSGGLGGGGAYTSGMTSPATPSMGRRFSLSTDRILPRDKTLHASSTGGGSRPLQQPSYQRRASIASSTLRSKNAFANPHLLEAGDYDEDLAGSLNRKATYSNSHHYTTGSIGASTVSPRGTSVRASSVSKYDSSQNSLGRPPVESSLYESYNGRAPSVSRYESQNSFIRSPSLSRYEGQISNGRAPSLSRYESQTSLSRYESQTPRAPSLSRYDSQSSVGRAPSVSRYEGYASTPRAPSLSRYETQTPRAPSLSRYESHGSVARAPSLSRYEVYGSTPRAPSLSRYETQTPRAPSLSRYDSQSSVASVSRYEVYGSTPRAPSVSRYESQSSVTRTPSVSNYEIHSSTARAPSLSRYESQGFVARAPSVPRYEGYASTPRAPSVSRYESQSSVASAPSVSRYESHGSAARAPSVSRYEGLASTPRAPSVSRIEGHTSVGRRFRSASVSRYEKSTHFAPSDEVDAYLDYSTGTRSISASRSSEHLVEPSTGDADDDTGYHLRRQLRAMRNHQVRGGSVARHDNRPSEPHVHHEAPVRPRSLSISSPHHHQRRYKVLTIQSPVKVPSPSSATAIITTGHPEPTLYSAKVFRSHDGAHSTVNSDLTGGATIGATSSEAAFIDNREDIASFVLKPGEKFLPTDVSVHLLPSGKKAVTYTQFSQKGSGDQRSANAEIERIITKTKLLQESMHTLEDFVKRNRSLFPEDIIIYQKIIFYLLSEAELRKMGERPDAEIYGVKIRERLVAPTGTDVASILKRFYSRHKEVDVEYEHVDVIRKQLQQSEMEAAAGGKLPPRRARHIPEELDLEKPSHLLPQSWQRSRSSDLYIDEEELVRRDGMARSPKAGQRPSAPEFTHRLRGQRAGVGQSVRLSCSVSAFPEPVVTWYRGKQEITQNGRFSVKHNNYSGLCTLTISDLTPEDGVLYTVKATNSEGEAATSGLLDVYDLPENSAYAQRPSVPLRKRSAEPNATAAGGAAGRRPFFLLEARNLWADVGERAVFEVQAAGKPLPSFTWVKDDCPVTEDDHVQFVSDGYGNCRLVIREIRETDFGTYRCLAQNEDGLIESIASLFCVGNESLRPGQELRNELRSSAGQHRGRKPTFVYSPPSRIDVIEGEPLTLQCTVDGDPKPLITWYKGVRELTYTGRHRVLEERNSCYLMQLKSTLATDSGEYTVTAHNLCGLAECIVYVNVLPAERALDDFDPNWKRLEFTPLDYELVTKTRQGKMPPIFVKKLPREKQFKLGESLKFDCLIEVTKPREYLVDVDIVLKGDKKEDTGPRRTDTKEDRKILLDALKPQPHPQHRASDYLKGQERSASREKVSSAQPSVIAFKADDIAKSTQPLPVDHGIVKLADNLAREISSAAVETVQQQQQQQQQHDSIIHQRNAGHELKAEDQEASITAVKDHEVQSLGKYEESDLNIDDKHKEIKTEETPTETKVEEKPTVIKVEDTPTETKVEETPTVIKVEDTPTETKTEDTSTVIKVEDTPTDTKTEETPTVIKVEDTPTETKSEETPTVIKVEDTSAVTKSEETPTVIKVEDTPTDTKSEETPTVIKVEDTPTETTVEETPTVIKVEETPTVIKVEDTSPKTEATPTESKTQERPTTVETEQEESLVKVVKVAESGVSAEGLDAKSETVGKTETTAAAAETITSTKDEKDHEDDESSSSESILSSSESEGESD